MCMYRTRSAKHDVGHRYPRCPESGKVRFRYRKDALSFVWYAKMRARQCEFEHLPCQRRENRTYKCTECGGWHVTSRPSWYTPT
jgi:hypothetical protein